MRLRRRTYLLYRRYLTTGRTPSELYGLEPTAWDHAFAEVAERLALWEAGGKDAADFEV